MHSVLLPGFLKENLPLLRDSGDPLSRPLDFLNQVVDRPGWRIRRGLEGLLGCLLVFRRLARADGQAAGGICDLVDLVRGQDLVDARAAGLEENGGRAVELEEELLRGMLVCSSIVLYRTTVTYPVTPDGHSRPCPDLVEQLHSALPCVRV